MIDILGGDIKCTVSIVLISRSDDLRRAQVQVAGKLSELITSFRLAGEGSTEVKKAIILAAELLQKDP